MIAPTESEVWCAVDRMVREVAPARLDALGFSGIAAIFRSGPPVASAETTPRRGGVLAVAKSILWDHGHRAAERAASLRDGDELEYLLARREIESPARAEAHRIVDMIEVALTPLWPPPGGTRSLPPWAALMIVNIARSLDV